MNIPMANDNTANKELEAVAVGQKLGVLINALEIGSEMRGALMALLPELDENQLKQLVLFLEASAAQAETADLDAELRREIMRIKTDYDAAVEKADSAAMAELEEVAAKLKP